MTTQTHSPEEISKLGERFYFDKLQKELEEEHRGEYVVIDVEEKKYVMNSDLVAAINEAKEKFGEKLFYIVKVGELEGSSVNFKKVKLFHF